MPSVRPMFTKPLGPSEYQGWADQYSEEDIVCELCGTEHKVDPDMDIAWFRVMGRVGVVLCCGALFDDFYEGFGRNAISLYMKEVAENPLDPEFSGFVYRMKDVLKKIQSRTAELQAVTTEALALIPD
jgi:hypothetical protein